MISNCFSVDFLGISKSTNIFLPQWELFYHLFSNLLCVIYLITLASLFLPDFPHVPVLTKRPIPIQRRDPKRSLGIQEVTPQQRGQLNGILEEDVAILGEVREVGQDWT